MNKYYVTVGLEFDVQVPISAPDEEGAKLKAEEMDLAELLEWAVGSSYCSNVLEVSD